MFDVIEEFSSSFDCLTIFTDNDILVDDDTKQFLKLKTVQIVKRRNLEVAVIDVIRDSSCGYFIFVGSIEDTQDIVKEISVLNNSVFSAGTWFVVCNQKDLVLDSDMEIAFDSNFNVLKKNSSSYYLYEVYDLGQDKITNKYGSWRKGEKMEVLIKNKWDRRKNLMGEHFR